MTEQDRVMYFSSPATANFLRQIADSHPPRDIFLDAAVNAGMREYLQLLGSDVTDEPEIRHIIRAALHALADKLEEPEGL